MYKLFEAMPIAWSVPVSDDDDIPSLTSEESEEEAFEPELEVATSTGLGGDSDGLECRAAEAADSPEATDQGPVVPPVVCLPAPHSYALHVAYARTFGGGQVADAGVRGESCARLACGVCVSAIGRTLLLGAALDGAPSGEGPSLVETRGGSVPSAVPERGAYTAGGDPREVPLAGLALWEEGVVADHVPVAAHRRGSSITTDQLGAQPASAPASGCTPLCERPVRASVTEIPLSHTAAPELEDEEGAVETLPLDPELWGSVSLVGDGVGEISGTCSAPALQADLSPGEVPAPPGVTPTSGAEPGVDSGGESGDDPPRG